ncbi:hypothetical protein BJ165DRAFT_1469636 [Panaeolus papilionaceus]|nr:hypothetical protein BJ165DRAFT_1469636 [Panaeolus papilionaceus]
MMISLSRAFTLLLGSAMLASAAERVINDELRNYHPCGTVVTDEDIAEMTHDLARLRIPRQAGIKNYEFDVYFNVVAKNMTTAGGWAPQSQVDAQVKLLNDRYVGTGVSWKLVSTTRILSRYWHETIDTDTPQTDDMQRLFRKGKSTALNVYTVGFYDANLNGYATLPNGYSRWPINDGAVILYATLPGGSSPNRQGGTLIHEAGHWLGLRHTFQGGCTGDGDGVDDTPPQGEANFGCPIGADSCPGDAFPDPIRMFSFFFH